MMRKSCGIILFRLNSGQREYLILKYPLEEDYWGLCKGTVEPGDGEEETALREAQEETGLKKITLIPKFREMIGYFFIESGQKIYKEVVYFLGKVLDLNQGRVSEEHELLLWLPFKEAVLKIKYEKDREVVKKAEAFLSSKE